MVKRVYFDTCVWCRLFDILDHERITEEYRAVHKLIDHARNGRLCVVRSEVLFYEAPKIEGPQREAVEKLINEITAEKIRMSDKTKTLHESIARDCKLKAMDALHVALAIENLVDIFFTTDDEILNKREDIEKYGIVVKNPIEYEVK